MSSTTRSSNRLQTLTALGLLGIFGAAASAQVAPPPPATEEPAATEPEPQPEPQAQPARSPNEAVRTSSLPTDIPYPKLAQRGEDGRIIRLKDLPEIEALRANPTVGPQSVDRMMPVIYGRRARHEMLVINNLDLYWELTDGLIDTMDMTNLEEMARVAEMLRPMVGKTTLSQELQNRGILTRTQGGMNEHIVREYKQAISDELQVLEGENGLAEFLRFILQDSIHEATLAYQGMLAEGIGQAEELLAEMGIENTEISAASGPLSTEISSAEQQIYDFDAAIRTLSVEQGIAFFEAMRNKRANVNVSPTVTRPVVTRPDKVDGTGNSTGFKVERFDSEGNKVSTSGDQQESTDP